MKTILRLLAAALPVLVMAGCIGGITKKGAVEEGDYLVLFDHTPSEAGSPRSQGYLNWKGDTIVPPGRYRYYYSDTIRHYGFVVNPDNECLAIDNNGNELYRVYWFDNGPDHAREGIFRIQDEDGNIGYASAEDGRVIVEPAFAFGEPFEADSARVAVDGYVIHLGEESYWDSDEWYYIDKEGNKL